MKIEEQVLSREQMAHLKELGVDTSGASMMWINRKSKTEGDFWYLQPNNQLSRDMLKATDDISYWFIPTYTIGDLIEKLPVCLNNKSYKRTIAIDGECVRAGYYEIISCTYPVMFQTSTEGQPVKDMLYKILCWVAENTYKRKLMKI